MAPLTYQDYYRQLPYAIEVYQWRAWRIHHMEAGGEQRFLTEEEAHSYAAEARYAKYRVIDRRDTEPAPPASRLQDSYWILESGDSGHSWTQIATAETLDEARRIARDTEDRDNPHSRTQICSDDGPCEYDPDNRVRIPDAMRDAEMAREIERRKARIAAGESAALLNQPFGNS